MKISALDLYGYNNAELYETLSTVVSQIREAFCKVPEYAAEFVNAADRYNATYEANKTSVTRSQISQADLNVDMAYTALLAYVIAMNGHPCEAVAQAAKEVRCAIEKYENPTELSYESEYKIMDELLADLNRLPADVIEKVNVAAWIKDLSDKCAYFNSINGTADREAENAVKMARRNVLPLYRDAISRMNVKLADARHADIRALESFAAVHNGYVERTTAVEAPKTQVRRVSHLSKLLAEL